MNLIVLPRNSSSGIATVRHALQEASDVHLVVYNIHGQRVRTLVNLHRQAGYHSVTWNGRDDAGRPAASGVYLVRMEAAEFVAVRRMVLVK